MRHTPELYIQLKAEEEIRRHGIDLSALTPQEVVDFHRFARQELDGIDEMVNDWDGHDVRDDLMSRLETTFQNLPDIDPDRTIAIIEAHLDSPNVEDRVFAGLSQMLPGLTCVDPDAGFILWDRKMRDSDREGHNSVAATAYGALTFHLELAAAQEALARGSGFYLLDGLDEAQVEGNCGLTKEMAYDLLLSYAYAENGEGIHDLGRAALDKLLASPPPIHVSPEAA